MLTAGTVLQGRYRIEGPLGQGGMSEVYAATHLELNVRCAIKTMQSFHLGDQDRLREQHKLEARLLYSLSHPNLARVTDFFEEDGCAYTVMEYVAGVDLGRVLGSPLPEEQVLAIAAQILDALDYLHSRQPPVIARDLNPRNIMMSPDGRIRLIDFGIAKELTPGRGTATIAHGTGTPGFAPLEQYGSGGTDRRSDLYALGATMLCLLTGAIPPEATDRVTRQVALPNPHLVHPNLSERTSTAISALMSVAPDDRPPSVSSARVVLGLPVGGGLPAIGQKSPATRGLQSRSTRRLPGQSPVLPPPSGRRADRKWAWALLLPLVLIPIGWFHTDTLPEPILLLPVAVQITEPAPTPAVAPQTRPKAHPVAPRPVQPRPVARPPVRVQPSIGPGITYPTRTGSLPNGTAMSRTAEPPGELPKSRIGCCGTFNGCFIIVFQRSPDAFTYAYTAQGSYFLDLQKTTGQMLNFGQMHPGQSGLVITNDRNEFLNWITVNKTEPEYTVLPSTLVSELEHNATRYYPEDRWPSGWRG